MGGATVTVYGEAFSDPRYEVLGDALGTDKHHALGLMCQIWRWCTERGTDVMTFRIVNALLKETPWTRTRLVGGEDDGLGSLAERIAYAELGEILKCTNKVHGDCSHLRIKGAAGRVEWYLENKSQKSLAGRSRAAGAARDSRGRMVPNKSDGLSSKSPAVAGGPMGTSDQRSLENVQRSGSGSGSGSGSSGIELEAPEKSTREGECEGERKNSPPKRGSSMRKGSEADSDSAQKPEKPDPEASEGRGKRLPDTWTPRPHELNILRKRGLEDASGISRFVEEFRAYWRGTGKSMRNWDATFRSRCLAGPLRSFLPEKHANGFDVMRAKTAALEQQERDTLTEPEWFRDAAKALGGEYD